ncbi:hypothetical protein Q3G72_011071 [Acer saccharum]|nr:hypothetical protein Q3G72_011071 [Acer saccharum]
MAASCGLLRLDLAALEEELGAQPLMKRGSIQTSGGEVAMDARNGRILWSTADPSNALAFGPVTLANGVLFAGSTHGKGPIYAMNAITGKVLWSYDTGGTVYGGMSTKNSKSLHFQETFKGSTSMAVPGCYNNLSVLLLSIFCLLTITATKDSDVNTKQVAQNWPNHGGDLYNRRYANKEKKISPKTMSKLHLKWKFYAGASDGLLVWKKNLQKLTGFVLNVNSTVSRSTPTIAGDLLIVGLFGPAVVIAAKRSNRNLMWSTGLDDHARDIAIADRGSTKKKVYGVSWRSNSCWDYEGCT